LFAHLWPLQLEHILPPSCRRIDRVAATRLNSGSAHNLDKIIRADLTLNKTMVSPILLNCPYYGS
jgi:hypothetical protein